MIDIPETRYAVARGDVHIAYQVVGDAPLDLVVVPGFASHVEMVWESPIARRFLERLASFARLIVFDKRGTGLSDPVAEVPTFDERMDDVRAVLDAARSERAALLGISEGAPLSILFAATYPARTEALVLYGAMARSTWAPDYPWAPPVEGVIEAGRMIAPAWGRGEHIEIFTPSLEDDPEARAFQARFERSAASPAMIAKLGRMFLDIDVRDVLPVVRAPTLVLHRRGDRVVNRRAGEWLASQIAGARYVELQGVDHLPWAGDGDGVLDEVEEFLTGIRRGAHDDDARVLATVLVTDIVRSTERAAALGDRAWRELLDRHDGAVRRQLERFGGTEIKTVGDGFVATFDGPGRAIRCADAIRGAVRALGLETRIGIHTGECEIRGGDLAGIAVHIAARICSFAGANEIVVSSTVKDLVAGSGIRFADRGAHVLKGVPDEWRLFGVEAFGR